METARRFFIDPKGIGFFKAILESYEEVGLMTVLDGRRGEIEMTYPTCQGEILAAIMADMERFGIVFREAADVR
jgi:hypothetical protein